MHAWLFIGGLWVFKTRERNQNTCVLARVRVWHHISIQSNGNKQEECVRAILFHSWHLQCIFVRLEAIGWVGRWLECVCHVFGYLVHSVYEVCFGRIWGSEQMNYYANFINPDSLLGCQSSCVKIRMGCVSNSRELGCVWRCVTTSETKTKRARLGL